MTKANMPVDCRPARVANALRSCGIETTLRVTYRTAFYIRAVAG